MNEMKQVRVDPILLSLMKDQANNPFSTTSLRDLYVSQSSDPDKLDRNTTRRYIDKELRRLLKIGLLKRYNGETGRGCKFIYRGAPSGIALKIKRSPFAKPKQESASSMDSATLKGLQEELSKRKVELMTSIGEAEEYQRLLKKYPALQKTIRTQYLESRDRSTKALGQLRAVETVLADLGHNA